MPSAQHPDWFHLDIAAGVILGGGVVAHATEGVWGLACDPYNEQAVERVARLKQRQAGKGFILIGTGGMFGPELHPVDPGTRQQIEQSWPGAVTWVLDTQRFPLSVTAPDGTIGVRVPGHRQARRLAAACDGPLLSTSANVAGRPPAISALAVRRYFGGAIDWVLPGTVLGNPGPSEVRIAASGRVVRGTESVARSTESVARSAEKG